MILFHGTGGDRALLASIFAEGLRPSSRPWAHEATGMESHVFACTTPIGTRGGDPIQFAQRGAWGARSAWLLVLDLPRDVVIHGAVPNDELERYWKARTFGDSVFHHHGRDLRALIAAMRRTRRAARDLLRYRVVRAEDGLTTDADTLVQFEQAFIRAAAKHKRRVAASYGLVLPGEYLEDIHQPFCMGCTFQLYEVDIVVPEAPGIAFSRGTWDRLDLSTFGMFADVLDRWLAAHGDPHVGSIDQLQARYPPPRDLVPRILWRDFATADLAERSRAPDTQLMLGHVPPEQIAGAVELGTRDRLSGLVRPGSGETLQRKLDYLARQIVDRRRETGRPVVLEA